MRIIKIICAVLLPFLLSAGCGRPDGDAVFTLRNEQGMTASFCSQGGRMISLEVPCRDGSLKNVVGCADRASGVVGRYAGRIARGRFDLDGYTWQLPVNDGRNHRDGGKDGFDRHDWILQKVSDCSLLMTRLSPDGEEAYPGNLEISVLVTLTDRNELVLQYAARTDAPTILNPTQRFRLDLHGGGEGPAASHILKINADAYIAVDEEQIPTGGMVPVEGTEFDFRTGKTVALPCDVDFVLRGAPGEAAAELYEPATGILLKIYTDQPDLHLSCDETGCGLLLETQHFPDAPNHPAFPSTVLLPGETYTQNTIYHFEIK